MSVSFKQNLWYFVLPAALLLAVIAYVGEEIYQSRSVNAYTPFEPLTPVMINGEKFLVSIADTNAERQLGLSYTETIPADVLKLFIFDTTDYWSFWMKDMQYAIDIVWLDEKGVVVHIEKNVSPNTYPTSFRPYVPARYVVEAATGFADRYQIIIGRQLPVVNILQN